MSFADRASMSFTEEVFLECIIHVGTKMTSMAADSIPPPASLAGGASMSFPFFFEAH